jgi:hypothetical protein
MRLCPERPLPLGQQHVQHLQQQMVHSAAQHKHRAMQKTTDRAMSAPTTIATITGHLWHVSLCVSGARSHELAVGLSHTVIP